MQDAHFCSPNQPCEAKRARQTEDEGLGKEADVKESGLSLLATMLSPLIFGNSQILVA